MRFQIQAVALLISTLLGHGVAQACSCVAPKGSEDEQVKAALSEASQVFTGKVVRLDRAFSDRYTTEDAELKITQVFKGSYAVGQVVRIRSTIGSGMCGRTLRESAEGGAMTPKASDLGEWLVYGYEEPFELSLCSRSRPVVNGPDVGILRALKDAAPVKPAQ